MKYFEQAYEMGKLAAKQERFLEDAKHLMEKLKQKEATRKDDDALLEPNDILPLSPEPIPHTYSHAARANIRFKHFIAEVLCRGDKALTEDEVTDIIGYIAHVMRYEVSSRVYLTTNSYDREQFQALLNLKHKLAVLTPITLEYSIVYWGGDGYVDEIELHIFATTDDETYQEWLEA